ncbi:MAG: FkbM family methyltransferase [Pseudomonadota bacterium]
MGLDRKSYARRWLSWHFGKKYKANEHQKADWAFRNLVRRLGPQDLAIDCGANIGVFTELMAARGATVHAFEPDPWTFAQLKTYFEGSKTVIPHQAAVGAAEGDVELFRHFEFDQDPARRSESASVLRDKPNVDLSHAITVKQIDLAAFIETLGRSVTVLKLDIEGAEFEVLGRLMDADLLHSIAHVFVETHDERIPSVAAAGAEIRARLKAGGYGNVNLDWR